MLGRVLAVLDLQGGRAVRGVGGQRDRYRPVFFDQTDWSDPLALGRYYLAHRVGGLYVADLDALTGRPLQTGAIAALLDLDCPLWIDAGIRGAPSADASQQMLRSPPVHRILATESFGLDRVAAQRWLAEGPAERLTVSIDMMDGKLLLPASDRRGITPSGREAIAFFYSLGFRSFLILDLSSVGRGKGPSSVALCRAVRAEFADIELIAGGGVRSRSDLGEFFAAGVDYVLVASALQNGAIFGPPPATKD